MKNTNLNIQDNNTFLAQWLEGTITDNELKKLISKEEFLSYNKIKQSLVLAKNLKPQKDSFSQIQQKIQQKNKTKVRKLYSNWFTTVAATVLFFIGLNHFLKSDLIINKSHFGQQKTIALLDNSEVILNANSTLTFNNKKWNSNREVFLTGEAFFKVKKGSTFKVETKNGNITVLGTQFKINTTADYFEVVCYEGSVKVITKNSTHILKSGEVFRKINGNVTESWKTIIKKPTWLDGESTFKSVPLEYVITKFENQFNVKIDASKINKNLIYTGSFNHDNITIALASVFKASNIKYKIITENKIILSKN